MSSDLGTRVCKGCVYASDIRLYAGETRVREGDTYKKYTCKDRRTCKRDTARVQGEREAHVREEETRARKGRVKRIKKEGTATHTYTHTYIHTHIHAHIHTATHSDK